MFLGAFLIERTSRKVVTVYRRPLPGVDGGEVLRDIPAAAIFRIGTLL